MIFCVKETKNFMLKHSFDEEESSRRELIYIISSNKHTKRVLRLTLAWQQKPYPKAIAPGILFFSLFHQYA